MILFPRNVTSTQSAFISSVKRFPFDHDYYEGTKLGKAVLGNDVESAIDDALALEGYTTSNTRDKGWTLPDTTYLQQGFTEICKAVVWMKVCLRSTTYCHRPCLTIIRSSRMNNP